MSNLLDTVKRLWARVRAMEPARLAEGVRVLLAAAVTLGWVTIDDARLNAIVSAVAVLGSVLLTKQVRSTVTPVAKLDGCTTCLEHDPGAQDTWDHVCEGWTVTIPTGTRCGTCGAGA